MLFLYNRFMDKRNRNDKADGRRQQILTELGSLPKGNITVKTIRGHERMYLQWTENGKRRSQYVRAAYEELFRQQIERRKELEQELGQLETVEDAPRTRGAEIDRNAAGTVAPPPVYWLKWQDTVIGEIDASYCVRFLAPEWNEVVRSHTGGRSSWSRQELIRFLEERIASPGRRDIEKILHRCGMTVYDPLKLGLITKGFSARDLLWIAEDEDERFEDAMTEVFESVFLRKTDLEGDSIDTPEGQNIKRYGAFKGSYGIYKKRISPVTMDIEAELAVPALGDLLGVECCPCIRVDEDTVFSEFRYSFSEEYIVHFRRLIDRRVSENELLNLLSVRPQYMADFARMIALDFITRQDDRHLSNIAVKISGKGESFYPLYDNGRSMFYEDSEETVRKACRDIAGFSTNFGPEGTYWDMVRMLSDQGISFAKILNLNIKNEQISKILRDSGFTGYRLNGAGKWIRSCIDHLKSLG